MRRILIALATCFLCVSVGRAGEKLSYVDLVKRLTDLERLAQLPEPGEQCVQWSSYDRSSRFDGQTGKYVAWGANRDGIGNIRVEGETEVFAEMQGPGVIWRIWSARTGPGCVKIFLDGADEPAVDLAFVKYFDRTAKPFVYESLCYMAARGQNCFVPIPFAKGCKIVAEKEWGRYFHFTYTLYPKSTQVPTFRLPLSTEEADALATADAYFKNDLGADPAGPREGQKTEARNATVPAGKAATVLDLKGPRAITAMKIKADLGDRADEMAALRRLALQITWDGEKSPSVWCPLGDFFGTAPGVNAYKSFPTGLTMRGGYAFWYMPFAVSAKVEIVNESDKDRKVEVEFTHAPLARPIEQLGRFHAKWHRDALLPKEPERAIDWTMLRTKGRGRFCGVMLHVWNPRGSWWGEGDEKFFVDGEKFPSTFGTGSEDYFSPSNHTR